MVIWLVVGTPLKNMKVNWDDYSIYLEIYKMVQTTNQLWYSNVFYISFYDDTVER